jgi:hypothetical protein
MKNEGFWYSVGDFFYTCFEGLEWVNETISPQWFLILVGAGFFSYWIYLQGKYNKEAAKNGTLK